MADDENENDEDQHFSDGMIATLMWRYGIVTLRRTTDLAKDETVQDHLFISVTSCHFQLIGSFLALFQPPPNPHPPGYIWY